ncbi:MAG TPA: hypothetical protein V6C65_22305, partial [Allocoleopsis sp.]
MSALNSAGVVHTNASGVLSTSLVNLTSDVTGILPIANGGSPFEQSNGAITERISTQDLLLGSNATSSAKFGFLNVAGGTPTASISGVNNNALSLTATGTIATTNKQTLTLGSSSTGNITLTNDALFNGNITQTGSTTFTTGTGLATIGGNLTVNGNAISLAGTNPTISTTGNNNLVLSSDADSGVYVGSSANTPAVLSVSGGIGGNAALIVNNNNSGDLLTASAAGNTRFTVANNGNIAATGTITGLTGITSSGTITLSALNAAGVVHTNANGVLSTSLVNLTSDVTGILPIANGGSPFEQSNGAITQRITTQDLLLGSTATNSAKFGFLNVAGGTPTASLSAATGATSLTANGVLGTTNAQTLQLGNTSTGNVSLVSGGSTALTATGANLVANGTLTGLTGLTSSGTITLSALNSAGVVHTNASGVLSTGLVNLASDVTGILPIANGGSPFEAANGAITERIATQDLLLGSTATTSAKFGFLNVNNGTPVASISAANGNNAAYLTGDGTLGTTNKQTLNIGSASTGDIVINSLSALQLNTTNNAAITTGTGLTTLGGSLTVNGNAISLTGTNPTISTTGSNNLILSSDFNSGVYVGSSSNTPAVLSVSGGIGNNAALIVNNNNSGDLLTASAAGNTRFTVANNGDIAATGAISGLTGITSSGTITLSSLNTAGVVHTNASGVLSTGWVNLTSDVTGILPIANGGSPFEQSNGAITERISTQDLLLGATATNS